MLTASIAHVLLLSDSVTTFPSYSFHSMTATISQPVTHILLGEIFDYDELQDIAQYGADTGVHGFTYSSDLYDVWVSHGEDIASYLEDFANDCLDKSWESMIINTLDPDSWTTQQMREKAIWCYLELRAQEITNEDY